MDEILFERRGCMGLITLNRPEALNALTYGMVLALETQLDAWAVDDADSRLSRSGAPVTRPLPPGATFGRSMMRAARTARRIFGSLPTSTASTPRSSAFPSPTSR